MTPVKIGAAMSVETLRSHRDWVVDGQRDLELQDFAAPGSVADIADDLIAEAKRLLSGYRGRLGIHGPFWGFAIHANDPDIREIVKARLAERLDICDRLGASHMVIHSPYSAWGHNNLDGIPGARDRMIADVRATIGDAVKRAETLGVTLVLENTEDVDPGDRRVLAESFDSQALKLSVDTGHAHCAHAMSGAPPVDYFISSAGPMLAHVHLQDCDGYADRHWKIGDGSILWPSVFRAIAALDETPRMILELRDPAGIPASMAYLEAAGLGC